nr:immunoglobulin light chain junction region [Macaca mulatta]
CQQHISFPFTF